MISYKALAAVHYVIDSKGNMTDVLVPVTTWETLLAHWRKLADRLEDQEDVDLARQWLVDREQGRAVTVALEQLERELLEDGLLPV